MNIADGEFNREDINKILFRVTKASFSMEVFTGALCLIWILCDKCNYNRNLSFSRFLSNADLPEFFSACFIAMVQIAYYHPYQYISPVISVVVGS